MIENYINQIITMPILADSITIIDDKGIIRYYKAFRKDYERFTTSQIVGKHFLDAFPYINKEESTVLKALRGESTFQGLFEQKDFLGRTYPITECVYPIRANGKIIGAACIARFFENYSRILDIDMNTYEGSSGFLDDIIGTSTQISQIKEQILRIAATDANVLICGETGTGKDLIAKAIHNLSERRKRIFYSQNCAAIPASLLESLFFGTEKGIYTGAVQHIGILEQCNGGTVFLDELNSLDVSLQAKFLRVLEEKKTRRLGSKKEISTDFRLIAAMNEDPLKCMQDGRIRSDLYYRLSTVSIKIPPLRERKEDIIALTHFFLQKMSFKDEKERHITEEVKNIFMIYSWPGNVRELKNVIESASIFAENTEIDVDDLPKYFMDAVKEEYRQNSQSNEYINFGKSANFDLYENLEHETLKQSIDRCEKEILIFYLETGMNHSQLARKLGVTRQTLLNKLSKHKLI